MRAIPTFFLLLAFASPSFAADTKDASGQYTIKDVQISFEGGDENEAAPELRADAPASPAPKAKGKKSPAKKKKPAASPTPKTK